MPLIVGLFIDKFGLRPSMIFLSLTVMSGQLIFCLAADHVQRSGAFHLMIIGRMIYGFGMVSMIFTQVAFITDWFVGPNLNFALSVTSSLPYAGCILDAWISPVLFEKADNGFGISFWLGFVFNCLGFLIVIVLCIIDHRAEKNLAKMKKAWNRISADADATNVVVIEKPKFSFSDLKDFGLLFWINCLSCAL